MTGTGKASRAIRTITFDLWQTLIIDHPENLRRARELRLEAASAALSGGGYTMCRETLERSYDESGRRIEMVWKEGRDLGAAEQVYLFLECASPGMTKNLDPEVVRQVERAYAGAVLEVMPELTDGARETIGAVKALGWRVGLISNTGRTPGSVLRDVLDRLGILGLFDTLTFSDEVRLRKPNPRIFLDTLASLRAEPGVALHVGDDLRADVGGARAAGMRAVYLSASGPGPGTIQPDLIIPGLRDLLPALTTWREDGAV